MNEATGFFSQEIKVLTADNLDPFFCEIIDFFRVKVILDFLYLTLNTNFFGVFLARFVLFRLQHRFS